MATRDSDKRRSDIRTNGGRIFGQTAVGYSDEQRRIFGRMEAKYLDKRRPDIPTNGGRRFGQTEAGYISFAQPFIPFQNRFKSSFSNKILKELMLALPFNVDFVDSVHFPGL